MRRASHGRRSAVYENPGLRKISCNSDAEPALTLTTREPAFSIEPTPQFEARKQDHLRLALEDSVQASDNGLHAVELVHEALPDLDFADVALSTSFGWTPLSSPLVVSSMTAGHQRSYAVNRVLAEFSSRRSILMGVGSQRRQLRDRS